jgi:replication factor A1
MQLPLKDIIERIKESTTLTQEEIEQKIQKKTEQLSGLISKEGAGQIIANELGVKLFDFEGSIKINRIVSGMRTVETVGKILKISDINTFTTKDGREGKVGNIIIGDETGRIRLTFWNEMTDKLSLFKEGDVLKIKDAYSKLNNNMVELAMSDKSKFFLNPEGQTINEVKETKGNRKWIKDLENSEDNVELLATIVQIFEPKFFEICPECNRRVKKEEDAFKCTEHGDVIPNYSYVMNAQIDDGTGNMRAVFFRNQAKNLLDKEESEILKFKDNIELFSSFKEDLLGNIVKLVGRVVKNAMFDRLEFVSQLVFINVDPKEEMKNMD